MSQQAGKIVAAWGPSTVGTEGEEKEEVDLGCSFVGVKNQNKCFFFFYQLCSRDSLILFHPFVLFTNIYHCVLLLFSTNNA